eukprot:gnl/TRDRNA2_/TRDRNA2_194915_c0_seq1.p1 gnl/TRDRNA2_/TRDRNA2_194915_c0~~gnl/TRDRNA2_/TRDRNA2_194915_c0_seq1.p1  ORF type:complete len:377 (-),score=62.55 gnl/TRDRNA2_/TRDRNA2_194915_c0_seq1:95-1225(-)
MNQDGSPQMRLLLCLLASTHAYAQELAAHHTANVQGTLSNRLLTASNRLLAAENNLAASLDRSRVLSSRLKANAATARGGMYSSVTAGNIRSFSNTPTPMLLSRGVLQKSVPSRQKAPQKIHAYPVDEHWEEAPVESVIFLNPDIVLEREEFEAVSVRLDKTMLEHLHWLVNVTKAKIVFSTFNEEFAVHMDWVFRRNGFPVHTCVGGCWAFAADEKDEPTRLRKEIKAWAADQPLVGFRFLILDDRDVGFSTDATLKQHFVPVDPVNGLTDEDVKLAKKIWDVVMTTTTTTTTSPPPTTTLLLTTVPSVTTEPSELTEPTEPTVPPAALLSQTPDVIRISAVALSSFFAGSALSFAAFCFGRRASTALEESLVIS